MSGWFGWDNSAGGAGPAAPTESDTTPKTQKVYYIGVWKSERPPGGNMEAAAPAHEMARCRDLSFINMFQRPVAGEAMDFTVKTAAESRIARDGKVRQQIDIQAGKYPLTLHSRGIDGTPDLVGIVIVQAGYSVPAAHSLLDKILKDFVKQHPRPTWINSQPTFQHREWMQLMKQYDEPEKVDDLSKIQKDLAETKAVLHKTIEAVLERDVKLDQLVEKSDQLSSASKIFYTQSKKQNSSCCILM